MVPRELQKYRQWVCWTRAGKAQTKLPISPATGKPASCIDPTTWGSYREARAAASRFRLDGIGFVFTSMDPFTGVDLDHCRARNGQTSRGDLEPWAAEIVERLNSYTEWSASGEGLHILVKGALPKYGGRRHGGIEIYSSGRYFTITGDRLDETPETIQDRQAEILELFAALDKKGRREPQPRLPSGPLVPSDEEVIRRARQAKNGAKFQRLWAGDTSAYDDDHSRRCGAVLVARVSHAGG
jgi:primase-polymerase (primpol)-like protein